MAQIVWADPALADLEAIAEWIALENRAAAVALVRRVLAHVEQLADHPRSGTRVAELKRSRYRQIVEPPCRVLYRVESEVISILHVMRTERLLRPEHLVRRPSTSTSTAKSKASATPKPDAMSRRQRRR